MLKLVLFSFSLLISTSCLAQGSSSGIGAKEVVDQFMDCRNIYDASQRLACFDQAAGLFAQAKEKREIVVLDRTEVKKTERSLFGFTLPKLDFFGPNEKNPSEEGIKEIEATITSVASAGYGRWALSLSDGSAWQTIEMNTSIVPRKGDPIRVERAALGSFRASIAGKKLLRIRRTG